jgi:hypothetical protein
MPALTPPAYARQLGVKPEKIRLWILRGELRAVNVAENIGGRPCWKIPPDAIEEFEARRAAKPPASKPKRKTKPLDSDCVEYV